MTEQRPAQIIEHILRWGKTNPRVSGIALVGSFARGTARPTSDIDLVILSHDPLSFRSDLTWVHDICWGEISSLVDPPDGNEKWFNWIVRESASNKAIGFVQASAPMEGEAAQIGYLFHPNYWGKGYAFEAVTEMLRLLKQEARIGLVWASIDPHNKRSISLMRRLGFIDSNIEAPVQGDIVMEKHLTNDCSPLIS